MQATAVRPPSDARGATSEKQAGGVLDAPSSQLGLARLLAAMLTADPFPWWKIFVASVRFDRRSCLVV
jgi:hypothetical protein